eukprot:COSAG01_NODE_980_length_12356_cov_77.766093_6_plen_102_part_00
MKKAQLPSWLAYIKPMPKGKVAALIVNLGESSAAAADASISLQEITSVLPATGAMAVRRPQSYAVLDVWSGVTSAHLLNATQPWQPSVSAHNSSFAIFSPQ